MSLILPKRFHNKKFQSIRTLHNIHVGFPAFGKDTLTRYAKSELEMGNKRRPTSASYLSGYKNQIFWQGQYRTQSNQKQIHWQSNTGGQASYIGQTRIKPLGFLT